MNPQLSPDIKKSPLIVALDFPSADPALAMAAQLDPALCRVKVGKELFTATGPELVRRLVGQGFDVFLDLKFHDIPNTVAKAVTATADLGVWMVNVHAIGGAEMIQAARTALDSESSSRPHLIAVTVLTSMSEMQLAALGVSRSLNDQVLHLAELAQKNGADGVVCSALEVGEIKRRVDADFLTVTPGIRPEGANADDQHRIMTPTQAIQNGSDYLVIGRPITRAKEPMVVVGDILDRLSCT